MISINWMQKSDRGVLIRDWN